MAHGRIVTKRRRGWLGAVAFLGPIAAGLLVTLFAPLRYSAALEVGTLLPFGLGILGLTVAMIGRRTLPTARGLYSVDINRRRWLWIPIFSILGVFSVATAVLDIADW